MMAAAASVDPEALAWVPIKGFKAALRTATALNLPDEEVTAMADHLARLAVCAKSSPGCVSTGAF